MTGKWLQLLLSWFLLSIFDLFFVIVLCTSSVLTLFRSSQRAVQDYGGPLQEDSFGESSVQPADSKGGNSSRRTLFQPSADSKGEISSRRAPFQPSDPHAPRYNDDIISQPNGSNGSSALREITNHPSPLKSSTHTKRGQRKTVSFDPVAIIHERAHPSSAALKPPHPSTKPLDNNLDKDSVNKRKRELSSPNNPMSQLSIHFDGTNNIVDLDTVNSTSAATRFPKYAELPKEVRVLICSFVVKHPGPIKPFYGTHSVANSSWKSLDRGINFPPMDILANTGNSAFSQDAIDAFYGYNLFELTDPDVAMDWFKKINPELKSGYKSVFKSAFDRIKKLRIVMGGSGTPLVENWEERWVKVWQYLAANLKPWGEFNHLEIYAGDGSRFGNYWEKKDGSKITFSLSVPNTCRVSSRGRFLVCHNPSLASPASSSVNLATIPFKSQQADSNTPTSNAGTAADVDEHGEFADEDDHPHFNFTNKTYRFANTLLAVPGKHVNRILLQMLKLRGLDYVWIDLGDMAGTHWADLASASMIATADQMELEVGPLLETVRGAYKARVKKDNGRS